MGLVEPHHHHYHHKYLLTSLDQTSHHIDVADAVDNVLGAVDVVVVEAHHTHLGSLGQADKTKILGIDYVVAGIRFQMKPDVEEHHTVNVDQLCHNVVVVECHEMDFVDRIDGMMQILENRKAYVLGNMTVMMVYA